MLLYINNIIILLIYNHSFEIGIMLPFTKIVKSRFTKCAWCERTRLQTNGNMA